MLNQLTFSSVKVISWNWFMTFFCIFKRSCTFVTGERKGAEWCSLAFSDTKLWICSGSLELSFIVIKIWFDLNWVLFRSRFWCLDFTSIFPSSLKCLHLFEIRICNTRITSMRSIVSVCLWIWEELNWWFFLVLIWYFWFSVNVVVIV